MVYHSSSSMASLILSYAVANRITSENSGSCSASHSKCSSAVFMNSKTTCLKSILCLTGLRRLLADGSLSDWRLPLDTPDITSGNDSSDAGEREGDGNAPARGAAAWRRPADTPDITWGSNSVLGVLVCWGSNAYRRPPIADQFSMLLTPHLWPYHVAITPQIRIEVHEAVLVVFAALGETGGWRPRLSGAVRVSNARNNVQLIFSFKSLAGIEELHHIRIVIAGEAFIYGLLGCNLIADPKRPLNR